MTGDGMAAGDTHPTSVAKIWKYIFKGYPGHSPDGREGAPEGRQPHGAPGELRWYEVPYGVVVSKAVDGLTVGGRIISQTHEADGWTRSQHACMVTGQAAGAAAALSAFTGNSPRDLDMALVQKELIRQGVDIGEVGAEYANT